MDAQQQLEEKFHVPLFDGGNYDNWRFRLEVLLDEKGLLSFVEQDVHTRLLEAPTTSEEEKDKKSREEANAKLLQRDKYCKRLIISSIADSQLEYCKGKTSSYEVWKELESTFRRKGIANQLQVRKTMLSMSHNPNVETLEQHFLKFDSCVRNLKSAGGNMEDMDLICHLLLTLPVEYNMVVTAIETLPNENLTLSFVKGRLLDEETKRKLKGKSKSNSNPSAVFTAQFRPPTQYHSKTLGFRNDFHSKPSRFQGQHHSRPPSSNNSGSHGFKCHNCGGMGHMRNNCPSSKKKFSMQGGSSHNAEVQCHSDGPRNSTSSSSDKNVCFVSDNSCEGNIGESMEIHEADSGESIKMLSFYVDSGCTDHIVNDASIFSSFMELKEQINISVAKQGECMIATGIGTISTYLVVNNVKTYCTLKNVLYVPNSRRNLLSVKKLERNNNSVLFEDGQVKIINDGQVIGIGHYKNLYEMTFYVIFDKSVESCVLETDEMWHRRLGHINFHSLKEMMNKGMVNGVNSNIQIDTNKFCEPCVGGKLTRLPFSSVRNRANDILKIVHSDLIGPITPVSHEGHRYVLTFIDDYSHFLYVYLLKEKSEVFSKFQEYYNYTKSLFNKSIHKLRCDNGGEYKSKEFQDFCKCNGIFIDYTIPYTPELNGTAERVNRTIVEKARTMLIEANMPKEYWSEAIYTAVYLMNRSITSCVKDKTPAEIWYNVKPNIANLRIFGCTVFYHVPKQLRSKLDEKAKKGVFLGYGCNGYRILDVEKKCIVLTRDIKSNENDFIFRNNCKPIDTEPGTVMFNPLPNTDNSFVEIDNVVDVEDNVEELITGNEPIEPTSNDDSTDRNKRQRKLPNRYEDYELYLAYCSQSFVENIPSCYEDVSSRNDEAQWFGAIDRELTSIADNKTWVIVDKPSNVQILDSKWVFSFKDYESKDVDQYKARLVIRGFAQKDNTYKYDELYSPVAKMTTIRTLLSVGNQRNYKFEQYDVKTAFLNGELQEDIYMYAPKGLTIDPGKVLKLKKALYGLKQAAKCWNDQFNKFMCKLGFVMSDNDTCLYVKKDKDKFVYLLLYVDDIIVTSDDQELLNHMRDELKCTFKIKDKGNLKYFLGIEINYDKDKGHLKLSQQRYTEKLLEKFNMINCKPSLVPLDPNFTFVPTENKNIICEKPYRELLGSLMYLMLGTRPDLCFAVNYFCRYQNNFNDELWFQLKNVLRYLRGTVNFGLVYTRQCQLDQFKLTCFVDSDWAGDKADRKSVSGFLYKFNEDIICWSTRKQPCVSLSTTEAEIVALCNSVVEGVWLEKLLEDVHVMSVQFNLLEDNQGCINILKNPGNNKRVKHIDIKYRYICDMIATKKINLKYLDSKSQIADILTKALPKDYFLKLRCEQGVIELG